MMIGADTVIEWFQSVKPSVRLETLINVMGICEPIELRFLASVLEGLNRRYPDQDGVKHIVNRLRFGSSQDDMDTIFDILKEEPPPPCHPNFPYHVILPNPSNPHQSAPSNGDPNVSNRFRTEDYSYLNSLNHVTRRPRPTSSNVNCVPSSANSNLNNNPKSVVSSVALNNGSQPDEQNELASSPVVELAKPILSDDRVRRRLLLFMSHLDTVNLEGGNGFFRLITDKENPSGPNKQSLEELDDRLLEELSVLGVIGKNHPAFAFSHRLYFANVLGIARCLLKNSVSYVPTSSGNHIPEDASDNETCTTASTMQNQSQNVSQLPVHENMPPPPTVQCVPNVNNPQPQSYYLANYAIPIANGPPPPISSTGVTAGAIRQIPYFAQPVPYPYSQMMHSPPPSAPYPPTSMMSQMPPPSITPSGAPILPTQPPTAPPSQPHQFATQPPNAVNSGTSVSVQSHIISEKATKLVSQSGVGGPLVNNERVSRGPPKGTPVVYANKKPVSYNSDAVVTVEGNLNVRNCDVQPWSHHGPHHGPSSAVNSIARESLPSAVVANNSGPPSVSQPSTNSRRHGPSPTTETMTFTNTNRKRNAIT